MTVVLDAKAPDETHAIRRRWGNTETPKLVVDTKESDQLKFSAWHVRASQIGVLTIVSGAREYSTASSGVEAFLVSSPQDQADAFFEAPGADPSDRLRCALLVHVLVSPGEESFPPEFVEQLLNRDPEVAAQRVRLSASLSGELPADKWMAEVRAWASSHPQRDRLVDDSRDSIYGDRY